LRRKAKEQAATERASRRAARAAENKRASRHRRARSGYAAWLDEQGARTPLTRANRHSQADETARPGRRRRGRDRGRDRRHRLTHARERRQPDRPAILTQALDNDVLAKAQPPPL